MSVLQKLAWWFLFAVFFAFVFQAGSGRLTQGNASDHKIAYELFELTSDKERKSVASGIRLYPLSDIFSPNKAAFIFSDIDERAVMVTSEFSVGAALSSQGYQTGFGLLLKRHPPWYAIWRSQGFSWEWFDFQKASETPENNLYIKRQGPGIVRGHFLTTDGKHELAAVEFLDDITFRLETRWPFSERRTFEMLVRRGSTLRLKPG